MTLVRFWQARKAFGGGLCDAGRVDEVSRAAHAAMGARDWATVRLLLHPYLHWTDASGRTIRGRTNVLAMLENSDPPDEPDSIELRDGQIYRWLEPPASS
jgi:hypothetical protein